MYTVDSPSVTGPRKTKTRQLSKRILLLSGVTDRPKAVRVATKADSGTQERAVALQAPYGAFRPLEAAKNFVAVHIHEKGRIEAYGPFKRGIDAYDYFPRDDTPHHTEIMVFCVPADGR